MHSGHVHGALVVVVVEAHCIVVETMTRLRRVYLGRGCVDWAAWTDVVRAFVLRCCAAFGRPWLPAWLARLRTRHAATLGPAPLPPGPGWALAALGIRGQKAVAATTPIAAAITKVPPAELSRGDADMRLTV